MHRREEKRRAIRWKARYTLVNADKKNYEYINRTTHLIPKEKPKGSTPAEQRPSSCSNAIKFQDILAAWQAANRVRLKESSISRYQNLIDTHILPELGDKPMNQITASVLNHFLAAKLEQGRVDLTGGLSAAYVRSIALVISSAIAFGVAENMCNPLQSKIRKPPITKKELQILETEKQAVLEKELLCDMCAEKLLVYITLYTGIRIGEACALRWEDIDLESRILHIRHTVTRVWRYADGKKKSSLIIGPPKSKSSLRCIPICSKLYTTLYNYPHKKRQGYVLANTINGYFLSPRTFEYRYKAILKKCSIEPVNYHALRHTFATRCIERGVDTKSLSEILGHSDVSITLNTYVHSSMELKRIQLEKLVS